MLVEVAGSSLAFDRRVRMPLYSRSGIQEAWLLDIGRAALTVSREPSPDGYRSARTPRRGSRIAPLAFPDRMLSVAELVGATEPPATR